MPELAAFSVLIGAAKSADLRGAPGFFMETFVILIFAEAAIAQLGERQTEDLKVPGSIPGLGILAMGGHGARPRFRKLVMQPGYQVATDRAAPAAYRRPAGSGCEDGHAVRARGRFRGGSATLRATPHPFQALLFFVESTPR